MNKLITIINYLYETKNGFSIGNFTINQFFEEGFISDFVSLVYDQEIPNLKKNITAGSNIKYNINIIINFLKTQNKAFLKFKRCLYVEEKESLLLTILRTKCFPMSARDIFNQSEELLKDFDLEVGNINDMFSGKFLISLLNVVTDGKVKFIRRVNEKTEFEEKIAKNLIKAKVPVVIDQNSFESNDPYFLIQLQIIFKKYPYFFANEDEKVDFDGSIPSNFLKSFRLKTSLRASLPPMENNEIVQLVKTTSYRSEECIKGFTECYSKNDPYINFVNYILSYQEPIINNLYNLYSNETNNIIDFAEIITDANLSMEGGDKNQKIDHMLKSLANFDSAFSETKFQFSKVSEIKNFIKLLIDKFYFNDKDQEILEKRIKAILRDYHYDFKAFIKFAENRGFLFFPVIQRLVLQKEGIFKREIFPPPNDFTFEHFKGIFDKYKVPFILNPKFQNEADSEIFVKLQLKIILDQFDSEYLVKIVKEYEAEVKYEKEHSESMNNDPLLQTINAIGSISGLHLSSIESIADGIKLPFYVESLLNETLTNHVDIKWSTQLSKKEVEQNNNNVVEFLKMKKERFRILLFDFKDPAKKLSSATSLCKNILNLFFLKEPADYYFRRCNNIIGSKIPICSAADFRMGHGFLGLLHFLENTRIDFKPNSFPIFDARVKKKFDKLNIPMILNEQCISTPEENEDYILYQLQFIFNRLDELALTKPSLKIVEQLLTAREGLKKIVIPDTPRIAINIRAQNAYQKYALKKSTEEKLVYKENSNNLLFDPIILANNKIRAKIESQLNNIEKIIENNPDSYEYWNSPDTQFSHYSKIKLNRDFIYINGEFEVKGLDHSAKKPNFIKKLKDELKPTNNMNVRTISRLNASNKQNEENLYKLFFYDEKEQRWKFIQEAFNAFAKDNGFTTGECSTCLVSFIDSNSEEVRKFNNKFTEGSLCESVTFGDNEEEITVYGLCHDMKYLTGILVKPIFLFIHVPRNKEISNLSTIIMQISIYLFTISDIEIVLANKEKIDHQIETMKIIKKISQNLEYKESEHLIFLGESSVQRYDKKNENSKFNEILKEEIKGSKLVPIDMNSPMNVFKEMMKQEIQEIQHINIYDVSLKFHHIPHNEISGLYIKLSFQQETELPTLLNEVIEERFNKLDKIDSISKAQKLLDELACFTPADDIEFNQCYRSTIYNKYFATNGFVRSDLKDKLSTCSDKQIENLKAIINRKLYIEPYEMTNMKNSYLMFLDRSFYDLIFISGFGRIADIIYVDYEQILEDQKLKDLKRIDHLLEGFMEKIKTKTKEVQRDINSDLLRSTRYIMKEVENVKETQIIIQSGGTLSDVIPQDF